MKFNYLFYKLPKHILDSFKLNHGLNYILGIILTFLIVFIGLDNAWYDFSLAHNWIYQTGFIPVIIGGLIPLLVPLIIYLYGTFKKNFVMQTLGLTLGQAALLGLLISSIMKVFTGRVAPETFGFHSLGGFRFGFYRGGAFNGWPSSHTTVAFAMAAAITNLYPEMKSLKIVCYAYAFFIGLGVSTNIHWLSDAVAGALIGYAIGKNIGKDFRELSINHKIYGSQS